jgi:hypothetical protein
MHKPLINILTRTSNRPNFFNRNVDSVNSQTYKNIRHIVSYDNDDDLEYINKHDNLTLVKIDKNKLIQEDDSPNPNTGKYSPHNLYFNEMLKIVEEGWVIFLDDDNIFSNDNSLEEISKYMLDDDNLIIWQINFVNNLILPPAEYLFTPPKLGSIDSACFSFNIKQLGNIKWDSWKCGDFRFILQIYNKIQNKIIIPRSFINIDNIGSGNKNDLK